MSFLNEKMGNNVKTRHFFFGLCYFTVLCYTKSMCREKKKDLFMLQVRLFRQAQIQWDLTARECSRLFNQHGVNDYIKTCYEFYHIQGDEANLADIKQYLCNKGVKL